MPALLVAGITIIVPLLFIYYAFTHRLPGPQYTDYAIVNNSLNLRSGSPVRIAGLDVGAVSGVSADGHNTRIAFTVDGAARPIHTDATIMIRPRLFLEGSYFLQLEPGSPSAPVAGEGYTIPLSHTSSPVQFFQVLSTFDLAARTDLAQLIKTTDTAFATGTDGTLDTSGVADLKRALPALAPLLTNTAIINEALQGTEPGDVNRLLTGGASVFSTLASQSGQLVALVTGLDQTAGALSGDDDALGRSIAGVDQVLKTAPAALTELDGSLAPLGTLARTLTPSLQQSPQLVSDLADEVRLVNGALAGAGGANLVTSLHTVLVGFPSTLTQLARFLPVTTPLSACLATHITPVLNEQVQDGPLSTGQPVWKDLVHSLPGLAGASGDFDANGPYQRALIGISDTSLPNTWLGSLSGVGQLVAAPPAGTSGAGTLEGASPQWVGELTASDFRPDVSCTSQPVPTNLTGNPADADSGGATGAGARAEEKRR